MAVRTFTAVIHKEDDLYIAECPEVGTVSQGYTVEDAITNLKEATDLYLEEFPLIVDQLGVLNANRLQAPAN